MEALLLFLGGVALVAIALLYGTFAWGFVCWKFWYWFLLPVFPTLPQVTLIQCVGLMVFMGLFHTNVPQMIKKEYRDEKAQNILQLVAPPLVLLLGWLIHVIVVK